jgi:hypothetical protein
MVMTALAPAIVVPDEQTWTMAGVDPAGLGVEPVFDVAAARRVLLPDRVPDTLAEPLRELLSALPSSAEPVDSELAFAGDVDAPRLQAGAHAHGRHDAGEHTRRTHDHAGHGDHEHHGEHEARDGHGDHEHHGGHESQGDHEHDGSHDDHHGGHDHHDMMAIVGEPSADGLVMESIELRLGPLGTPLPAGVVADVTLDGDVVAECTLTALLVNADPPDPLAPKAWERVAAAANDVAGRPPTDRWLALAAAEVERALSHTAWLRAFGRVLGWRPLVERAGAAISLVLEARSLGPSELAVAEIALAELAQFAERSRRLRWRTAGRACVSSDDARRLGLAGPAARASGLPDDARSDDPLYRQLGFEPLVRSEGDAWARTVLRATESVAALRLASAAAAESAVPDAPLASVVEGPRGPLRATSEGPEAPGESALLAAAGATAVGAEWAAAVVGIASFDLSPWRVTR